MHLGFSSFGFVAAFLASVVFAFSSGCASGGYKLTREYSRWVNSQNIILRVVLYILTLVVYAVTLLVDAVVFNTIDFWEGRVSQGAFQHNENGRVYLVQHQVHPATGLRKSTILIKESGKGKVLQEVTLQETSEQRIQLFVDGQLRTEVRDLSTLPTITSLSATGNVENSQPLWLVMPSQVERKVASN